MMRPLPSGWRDTLSGVPASRCRSARRPLYTGFVMTSQPVEPKQGHSLELPVEELLLRARPLPPHEEMVIDDLTEEEGAAFLAALEE